MSIIRNILNSTKALVSNSLPTTGSNTFVGTQTYSGSIIPATNNTYDLGSETKQFRHLYLSSGSLYIDGQKVLGSTGNELQITTDNGQSIKILEAGSDNIILQSADGNIELKTSGGGDVILDPTNGVIGVKGTMTIYSGNKLLSSDGNAIQFGNDLGITGSIITTGNVNGVNLSTLSSSLDSRIVTEKNRIDAILSAADADKDTFVEIVTLINSVDTSNDSAFASFYTGSNNRLNNIESVTGSYETKGSGIVSGSSQIVGILSSLNTYTGSNDTTNTTQNARLTSIESVTGSYETKGRGIVSGSSQITLSSTTGYGSVLNQAVLTTSSPTFAAVSATTFTGALSGNASTVTNGVYTSGDQSISGVKTFAVIRGDSGTNYPHSFTNSDAGNTHWTNRGDRLLTSNGSNWAADGRDPIMALVSGNNSTVRGNAIALALHHEGQDNGTYSPMIAFSNRSNSGQYNTTYAAIMGRKTGQGNDTNWSQGELHFFANPAGTYMGDTPNFLLSSTTATFSGTITENSSIRYKENVETIKYGLDKVLQMRGVTYDKKDNGVKEMGVIAEELYEVLPEVVLKNEEGEIDSVSYGRIVGVLIEAIKEQQKQIEELKSLIK
jgi:hypothetical protein